MFTENQEILEKRYKVIKRLGGGAFGEIYRGKWLQTPRIPGSIVPIKRDFEINPYCSRKEEDWRTPGCQSGK